MVGTLPEPLGKDGLGRLVADAQRAFAGADVAFVNDGNTRQPGLDAGPVTYAEAQLVQAYEHPIVRMRLSGRDVLAIWRSRGGAALYESGVEGVRPEGTYTVAANAVLVAAARFRRHFESGSGPERVGTDLEALVAWLGRTR